MPLLISPNGKLEDQHVLVSANLRRRDQVAVQRTKLFFGPTPCLYLGAVWSSPILGYRVTVGGSRCL